MLAEREPETWPVLPLAASCVGVSWAGGPQNASKYYRARYYDPKVGRFISEDPVGFRGGVNFYGYVLQNPTGYVDPSGLLVTITITRDTYTANSITGTLTATSDVLADTVTAYTLENYPNPRPWGDKGAISPGTYEAFVRTNRQPNRIELRDVLGYENIQIHVGNYPFQVEGCFLIGQTRATDTVGDSAIAMNALLNLVAQDAVWGDGRIRVIVNGWPWNP